MIGGNILHHPKNELILAAFICMLSIVGPFFLGPYAPSMAQETDWFCHPYGPVEYQGDSDRDGLEVVAFIKGQEFASCLTKDGEYSLFIPKDDPVTLEKEGWEERDIITIKVNGLVANPSFEAFEGARWIKLSVSTLSVPPTTWGKIKALFR